MVANPCPVIFVHWDVESSRQFDFTCCWWQRRLALTRYWFCVCLNWVNIKFDQLGRWNIQKLALKKGTAPHAASSAGRKTDFSPVPIRTGPAMTLRFLGGRWVNGAEKHAVHKPELFPRRRRFNDQKVFQKLPALPGDGILKIRHTICYRFWDRFGERKTVTASVHKNYTAAINARVGG